MAMMASQIGLMRAQADNIRADTEEKKDNATILVTHYQRLLDYIVPDFVHVMQAGRIVMTGGKELALELETRGYDWITANKQQDAGVSA